MEPLQRQIIELNDKIDQIHSVVERLSSQIAMLVCEKQPSLGPENAQAPTLAEIRLSSPAINGGRLQSVMEHKDVLIDGSEGKNQLMSTSEQNLAPEIQIRRLTAQLTAAYNRIAALEEQLFTCRIHS
jgi:uncharacterized coiled-coil protein SlyX